MSTSRRNDLGWKYVVEDPMNHKKVKCIFCGKVSDGIKRQKHHLAGIENTAKCTKCPPEVVQEIKTYVETKKLKKEKEDEEQERLRREKEEYEDEMQSLKKKLKLANLSLSQALKDKDDRLKKQKQIWSRLNESRKMVKELKSKSLILKKFIDSVGESVQELKVGCESTKKEVVKAKEMSCEEINQFGWEVKRLLNYDGLLPEKESHLMINFKVFKNPSYGV